MKKSTLFMACCIGLMLLASCKKDPVAPTITIFNGSGYVTENTQLYSGEEIAVGFTATGEKLTKIEVTLMGNGTVLASHSENIENQPNYTYSHAFTIDTIGTIAITGTVTDANGLTASKSFNITINEKPNKKFVGHYEGDILLNGVFHVNINDMDPIDQDLVDHALSTVVDIEAGENMNEVTATFTFNEQTNSMKGTVDGNKVVFQAEDAPFSFNYDYQGFNVPITLKMNYTINGTLNEGQLGIDGNCKGNGDITVLFYTGTVDLEGTLGGSLNKIR